MNHTDSDCDIQNPECLSPHTVVPWETDFAAIVPRFTGSISAISSSLIIYVIMRSEKRLSTIYHRIMFFMSLADICGSIAIALTTLPMPSYMPKEEVFGYSWAGTRLGNTATCTAQGFVAMFGTTCMYAYNAMLCVYYACAIGFSMRERNIKKYAEPILHGYPLLTASLASVPPLIYGMYNPGVTANAWCGPIPYPEECADMEGIECIRGNAGARNAIQLLIPTSIFMLMLNIIVPLTFVIRKVIQTNCLLDRISKLCRDNGNVNIQRLMQKQHNTRAAVIQALSYVAAFLMGFIPTLILFLSASDTSDTNGKVNTELTAKLFLVFLPLEGFFNFIIFISHKVYNYRRVHPDVSICHVLGLLFSTKIYYDPVFISRISLVHQEEEENDNVASAERCQEIIIRDESNEELHFRLGLLMGSHVVDEVVGIHDDDFEEKEPYSDDDDSEQHRLVNNDGDTIEPTSSENCHVKTSDSQTHDRPCEDSSDMVTISSRPSLNISLRETDLSIDEGNLRKDTEKEYYRNVM